MRLKEIEDGERRFKADQEERERRFKADQEERERRFKLDLERLEQLRNSDFWKVIVAAIGAAGVIGGVIGHFFFK